MAIALSAAGFKNAISSSFLALSKASSTAFEPSILLVMATAFDVCLRFVVPRLTYSIVNKFLLMTKLFVPRYEVKLDPQTGAHTRVSFGDQFSGGQIYTNNIDETELTGNELAQFAGLYHELTTGLTRK